MLVAVIVLAGAFAVAVKLKVDSDLRSALHAYRTQAAGETQTTVESIEEKFAQIYGSLRTIGMLPSVRRIDRHGTNLDDDALASIQQLYNNLKANVDVSEVYIVPVGINPERIDPVTGALEAPILMFDQLIVGAANRAIAEGQEVGEEEFEEPEVEIFEYRAFRDQMTWLKAHAPTDAGFQGLERPMLSSPEVMTCDNTIFVRTGRDADRLGFMFSVPFYGLDGALKGTVSAIMRTRALAAYLPNGNFALLNDELGARIVSEAAGLASTSASAEAGSLHYSSLIDLGVRDPEAHWQLWAGRPNQDFTHSTAVRSISAFRWTASVLAALLAVGVAAFLVAIAGRFRAQGMQRAELERQVGDRTAALSTMAQEQRQLRAAADNANQMKSTFLANMSHELRTPLNAIIGYSEMILEDFEDEKTDATAEDVDRILKSGRHLLALINQILDLAKVESGRVEITNERFDAAALAAASIETIRPAALANEVTLRVDGGQGLGAGCGDEFKLKQCLLNLLSNAVKFSKGGSVTLEARRVRQGDVEMFEFSVVDNGVGIKPEQVERIFQPFAQADAGTEGKYGGTGLGLAITRNMARMLGGDILVTSTWGQGSTFTLRAPVNFSPRATAAAPVGVAA